MGWGGEASGRGGVGERGVQVGGRGAKGAFWFPKVNKRPSYHQYKTVPTDPSGWMCWGVGGMGVVGWWGGGVVVVVKQGQVEGWEGVGGRGGVGVGGVWGGDAGCSRKYQQYVIVCQVASGIKNNFSPSCYCIAHSLLIHTTAKPVRSQSYTFSRRKYIVFTPRNAHSLLIHTTAKPVRS